MPAIRDAKFSLESVTTDAGLTMTMPTSVEGDLLIGQITNDTGPNTYTLPAGWNTLFERFNNVQTLCFWKYATSSEPATIFVDSSKVETYHGALWSVQDVDQTYPFGNPAVYGEDTNNITGGGRITLPSITTTRDNSLILAFVTGGTIGEHLGIEGLFQHSIYGRGANESFGSGWFFKATAGALPTQHLSATQTTGAGVKAVIQIQPPATGATVIPAHIADEDGELVNPLGGTTSPGSYLTAAPTGTGLTTTFSSTIDGRTVTGSGSSGAGGLGIYPELCAMRPSPSTAGNFSGLLATFTTPIDLSSRKLFGHINVPSLTERRIPATIERGGACIGLKSGTGSDWKIWSIFGGNDANINNYFNPFVIDPSTTATLASSGTLDPSAITAMCLLNSFDGTSGNTGSVSSLWAIASTTVAGGTSSTSISLPEIIDCIGDKKYRRAGLIQGQSQAQLSVPVIIGNGGTNKVNFNFDGTSISFPSQYSLARRTAQINVNDNWLGLKYNLGANDKIIHTNSIISSPSRFHWGLHASSSTSATYDFTRLSVIGAGAITLNKAITISRLIINDYVTLDVTDLTLSNCTIAGVPTGNDSVTLDADTTFTGCTIDVSGVTAGNRWLSTATPNKFTSCNFTGGGGHAIRITTAGTYTFSGNQITGFGANTTDGAFFLNDSGGAVTINVAGGGSTPTYKNVGASTTTIVSGATLTLTGLQTGSDIVILEAGTSTEKVNINENSGSTYAYSYTSNDTIDICVYKIGYEPFAIRSYVLSGTDGSIPIAQRADRAYNNPA